jgi:hypothetical protein
MRRQAGRLAVLLALMLSCVALLPAEEQVVLVRSNQPNTQRIPFVVIRQDRKTADVVGLTMEWQPTDSGAMVEGLPEFVFDDAVKGVARRALQSQLWLSALAGGIVWQQPWREARWRLDNAPDGDEASIGAGLSIALVATAAGLPFPQDLTVIGGLNYDNSLAPVHNLEARLRAAAREKIKRVVIPLNQRYDVTSDGQVVSAEAVAERLGLQTIAAADLSEAVEQVLGCRLPTNFDLASMPRYGREMLLALERVSRGELEVLNKGRSAWPRTPDQLKAVSSRERLLWEDAQHFYDQGLGAFRAGQMYAAYRYLTLGRGVLNALDRRATQKALPPVEKDLEEASRLRAQVGTLLDSSALDRDDVNSALVIAERSDWLGSIETRVTGLQLIVSASSSTRADATEMQRMGARDRLFDAVCISRYLLDSSKALDALFQLVKETKSVSTHGRPEMWLPQLVFTHVAKARFFVLGLKENANRVQSMLVWDPEVAAYSRFLRGAVSERNAMANQLALEEGQPKPDMASVGFNPGPAYTMYRPAVVEEGGRQLSGTARCFSWVNAGTHAAVLEQKYLYLGGTYDAANWQWRTTSEPQLRALLQFAEIGARRGIGLAQEVGADTSFLALTYEWASNLRASPRDAERLEALRQYWRCGMLGSLAWQLGHAPTQGPISVQKATPVANEDKKGTASEAAVPKATPVEDKKAAKEKDKAKGKEKEKPKEVKGTKEPPIAPAVPVTPPVVHEVPAVAPAQTVPTAPAVPAVPQSEPPAPRAEPVAPAEAPVERVVPAPVVPRAEPVVPVPPPEEPAMPIRRAEPVEPSPTPEPTPSPDPTAPGQGQPNPVPRDGRVAPFF